MEVVKFSKRKLDKIYGRYFSKRKSVEEKVRGIIEDVRQNGDEAVIKYTRKFDKINLAPKQLKVTESEVNGAYQNIDPKFIQYLKTAVENVTRFYKKQVKKSWKIKDEDGVKLQQVYHPLESVGIYIPASTAPLVSTVYMTVPLAKLAGVKNIVLATPPNAYKSADSYILALAKLLKVEKIFKVGGAQAIAALAFGTKTIPKVDKIVGPGNIYVTEAKRQVFGDVDIEMTAGPSEVVIIANNSANPDFVKADLLAQSEHTMGISILITTSKSLVKKLKKEVEGGYIIKVDNLNQAADIANKIAPEHLELMVKSPYKLLRRIKNAGAIFVGNYTPTAVGDYIAGPSHVLPTGGTARFFSGLSIDDFMRSTHIISYSKRALEKVREPLEQIAKVEGLIKHLESVRIRCK
ncbi:MAG: histidinol dehydrogenase [Candidatus Omnitrophica bacterium]|nr:histidinol dehydrogenase [Candidatus Omnitrophota bacterium]